MGLRYRDQLRLEFGDLPLGIDDLFLLEPFQLAMLPQRAPERALAGVLASDPRLRRFISVRQPRLARWLDELAKKYDPAPEAIVEQRDEVVWELADWLVYQRFPEAYDAKHGLQFSLSELQEDCELGGATVIDAGAGTGWLTQALAHCAGTVFAVEPVSRLRSFIVARAEAAGLRNVHVVDGFLDAIPLPDDSADVLVTARAVGWRLQAELREVQRVVRPGGTAAHFLGKGEDEPDGDLDDAMARWGYRRTRYREGQRWCVEYIKRIDGSGA